MLAQIFCFGLLLWAAVSRLIRRRAVRRLERAKGCHPITKRYPHLDIFGGLDLSIQTWREFRRGELSEGMKRRHDRYGSTFMAKGLGSECIYTIDHHNIRTVTTTNFDHWGKSAWVEEAAKHVGNGVLLNEGEAWKTSRNLLRPIFTRTAADTPTLLEPHLQRLIGIMRAKRGAAFDFQRLAGVFVLDVTTEFLFGQPTNCLAGGAGAEDALHFLTLVKQFEPPSAMFMAVGALAWLQLLPNYRALIQCVTGMKSFFRRRLDSIIASGKTPPLSSSAESRTTTTTTSSSPNVFRMMKAQGIPRERIQGELQNIFFASYDTTTALLSNLVELLARNTGVQQRLREEIAKCLEGRQAKSQDLVRMEYLQCVISEALRLYSPVTSHSRQANQDTTLPRGGGADGSLPILVPAGTTVVWSTYALNRNREVYGPDWAEFRPDRWTDRRGGSSSLFFMPFGSGPRTCMGQQLVQAEVGLVLVRLLQAFSELRCEDPVPFREAKAVSFYNCNGTLISARS